MSIDDPTEDATGVHRGPHQSQIKQFQPTGPDDQRQQLNPTQAEYHLNASQPSTCQQPKTLATTVPSRRNLNEKNEPSEERSQSEANAENDKKEEALTEPTSIAASQPARRLSVQDRINLFENKQKESSGGSGSGGKPLVGKPVELRRLSSDVSSVPVAVERAVLRRWSDASDMSIDVSGEKKDIESPLCTPSSASSLSQAKQNNIFSGACEDKDGKGLNDTDNSSKVDAKCDSGRFGDGGLKDQTEVQSRVDGVLGKEEEVSVKARTNWKDQAGSHSQSRAFTGRAEPVGLSDQGVSQEKLTVSLGNKERIGGVKNQVGVETQLSGFSFQAEVVGGKNKAGTFSSKAGDGAYDGGFVNRVEKSGPRDQPVTQSRARSSQSHSRSLSGQFDGGSGLKLKGTPSAQLKGVEVNQLDPQPRWSSFTGELEEVGKKELGSSDRQQLKVEDSGVLNMKFQKPVSAGREQTKKSQGRRDEIGVAGENSKLDNPGKKISETLESVSTISTTPLEQVQRVRQSKGNQELNDELKMKANELEKLFAEHKLRVPGDQSSSARRNKPADKQMEQAASLQHRKPAAAAAEVTPAELPDKNSVIERAWSSVNLSQCNTTSPLMKMVDNQDYSDTLRKNFSELNFTDDSRGQFYERYMQKRDAKLKEEWSSNRAEKEAKMKAMQDNLERSRAEMKAKFSASADKVDSLSGARLRAEKLRSFNLRSSVKMEQVLLF
jgi:hypothetical protein